MLNIVILLHSRIYFLLYRSFYFYDMLVDHQFNVKIADLELGVMTGDAGLSAYDVPAGREDTPAFENR